MALVKRKPSPKGPCIFEDQGCWQDAVVAGMCMACYSWWRNIQLFTAPQLTLYKKRMGRISQRVNRLGSLSPKRHLRRVK